MNSKYDVVVVGSIFMDLICYSDRLPVPGETIGGHDFKTGYGGKGANQCVAAQRLGAKTAFVGKLGDDANGHMYYKHFKAEGVHVEDSLTIDPDVPTGVASIMVGANDGQNMIVCVGGANRLITPEFVQAKGEPLIQNAKIVLCQMEIPIEATHEALKLAKKHTATTILNVAPGVSHVSKEMFQLSDILCVNETEAEIICGVSGVQELSQAKLAIEKLVADFGCANVIITIGPQGALLWDQMTFHYEAAPKIEHVVDTTGAGDCFIGVLAYCLAQGETLVSAVKKSVRNASESVKHKGTQASFPHKLL